MPPKRKSTKQNVNKKRVLEKEQVPETPPDSSSSGEKGGKIQKTEDKTSIAKRRLLFDDGDVTRNYWILKSEPNQRMKCGVDVSYSISQLMGEPEQTTTWEGVRNSEASNYLRLMKLGDIGIFYHSNCKVPGMVAIVKIVREAYPDETQFDAGNPYYDYRSSLDKPRWCAVDVKFVRLLKRPLSLAEIRLHHGEHVKNDGPLKNLMLIKRVRLSIQPLNKEEYQFILELEQQM